MYQVYWDYDQPNILAKRFEELIANPMDEFTEIFSHLQIVPTLLSEKYVRTVVDRCSFDKLSGGRNLGEENVHQRYRKGVAGDWKNHFSQRHINRFKELFNPVLLKTGYEKSGLEVSVDATRLSVSGL